MRKTSECADQPFPYSLSTICYIFADKLGNVYQLPNDMSFENAFQIASLDNGKIIAIWPGKYRTDAFEVDDLKALGLSKGFIKEPLPVTIIGFEESRFGSHGRGSRTYDVFYKCNENNDKLKCGIGDFNIRFCDMLADKFGWDIAKSKGFSGKYSYIDDVQIFSVSVKNEYRTSWGEVPTE
jgi:hypothetical protein